MYLSKRIQRSVIRFSQLVINHTSIWSTVALARPRPNNHRQTTFHSLLPGKTYDLLKRSRGVSLLPFLEKETDADPHPFSPSFEISTKHLIKEDKEVC